MAATIGERALAVFVEHQVARSRDMHRSMDALWRYVPGAIHNVAEWKTRLAAIREQERELCSLVPLSILRRAEHGLRENRDGDPERERERLEDDILEVSTALLRCLGTLCECESSEYQSARYVRSDFHRHVIVRTLNMLQDAYYDHLAGGFDQGLHYGISLRELLLTLDGMSQLPLPADDASVQRFERLRRRATHMAHELYTYSDDFVELDRFMGKKMFIDSYVYSKPCWLA